MTEWPQRSVTETTALLTAPGAPFEWKRALLTAAQCVPTGTAFLRCAPFRIWTALGDREFLVFEDDRVTFDDHARAVSVLARYLVEHCVSVTAIASPSPCATFLNGRGLLGRCCDRSGVTPLNAWGTADELAYGITHSGSKVALSTAKGSCVWNGDGVSRRTVVIAARAEGAKSTLEDIIGKVADYAALPDVALPDVEIHPDDDATLFYTSGPPAVRRCAWHAASNPHQSRQRRFRQRLRRCTARQPLPKDDPSAPQKTSLLPAPFFHVTGCHSNLIPAMAKGASSSSCTNGMRSARWN